MNGTKDTVKVYLALAGMMVGLCLAGPPGCGPSGKKKPKQPPEAKLTRRAKLPPSYPEAQPVPIDESLAKKARAELAEALHSRHVLIRVHAIESVRHALGTQAREEIVMALDDPAWQVRFAAALAAGELQLAEAKPKLLAQLDKPFPNVRIASIFALHRLGDTRYSHDLEKFARNSDPKVRANTVMILGRLEEKSALKILRVMRADRDPFVRIQASEAMWRLGNEDGLKDLVAATVSAYPDSQMSAFMALAAPRDTRIIEHVRGGLTSDYREVGLVAARAMGMLGSDEGYGVAMQGIKAVDPRHRILAAMAFGAIGRADAQPMLAPLLDDSNPDVGLAAATAILQLRE